MNPREAILSKVRAKTGAAQPAQNSRSEIRMPTPHFSDQGESDDVTLFKTMLEQVHGTCKSIENIEYLADAVRNYLGSNDNQIRLLISPIPELTRLDWGEFATEARPAMQQDQISITLAYAGIAETGTIVMVSSHKSPVTLSFLPEINIVVLNQSRLVKSMEDFWPMLESQPRAINFITGPSKTADIEQTIVYGAHGPRQFHVILTKD